MIERFHKFPFIIIDKNKKITNYSNNFENIWSEFTKLNIRNLADFIIEKVERGEFIVNLSANIFFLVVDKEIDFWVVNFIDITNISYKFEHYIDIDSFLHEIKNPLTVIDGIMQILSDKHLDNYTMECVKIVSSEIDRIKTLLEELKLIKQVILIKSEINLPEFIDEIIASLRIIFSDITFKVEFDPAIDKICGDKQKLFRAFYNIIKNACEAKKNSVINISIFIESSIKYYDKLNNVYSNMVKFNITDLAGGISEEVREKIFKPFFSTKSKGFGLGLSIARQIIESHDGKIEFKSINGVGTTFSILLPL
jgi:nitrogen-specific signal transduction histidine kinase